MRRFLVVMLTFGLSLMVAQGVTESQFVYQLPGDVVYPEGIAYDPASGNFYVSSTTDGTIYQVEVETAEVTTFSLGGSDGRSTALGMTVDEQGRLWIAGGGTGQIFVYDTATGELIRQYTTPEAEATLINDVITTPAGDAYITDSFRPVLFKIPASAEEVGELESWLDFTGTALEYQEGVNLNGIEATDDGRYLIAVQMNTGRLFRIDVESEEISEIDLGGETLVRGDGLVLDAQTLYVVYNRHPEEINISAVELSEDFSNGTVVANFTDPLIAFSAATAAQVEDRLLVVNAQFDRREAGDPELPFSVVSIPISMILEAQATEGEVAEGEEELFAQFMPEGEEVYARVCAVCHGQEGMGGVGPRLAGYSLLNNQRVLIDIIINGTGAMPPYGDQLSDREVAAVATFVRNAWGNEFGLITEREVEERR